MEFHVLGPFEVRRAGRPLPLGGAKARALLAVLLLHADQLVTDERLIDELWEDRPPPTARNLVQGHVSHLRRALGDDELIVTRPHGYLLRLDGRAGPNELDRIGFERLLQQGLSAEGRTRAARLREALALWRGAALADVPRTPSVVAEAVRLDELRLVALEERVEADLALGRHQELLGELRSLTAVHPLRDSFRAQLMLALHRCGRQAEALAAYREAYREFADLLGIEPGRRLRQLELAIHTDDPSLDLGTTGAPAAEGPAQLPPDIEDFTGREDVLAELDRLLDAGGSGVGPVVVVSGPAGVGKTALATHLARRVRHRFPDGQLWVGLNGAEPQPLEPGRVLAQFLRALGVQGAIPEDVAERAARYRSSLADSSVLVVLDDAAGTAQVAPLLPAGAGCAVLITSRRQLAELPGARARVLDVLPAGPAVDLLAKVAGTDRVEAEPAAAERIVELCGRLPLAIRIAGARLATREHWSLDRLAGRLADERGRLDELHAGDLDIRVTFGLAYRSLPAADQEAFRLLGLAEGPDVPAWAAAVLFDLDDAAAEERLDRLADARLVEVDARPRTDRARYRQHDLLRLFSRERLAEEAPPEVRQAALDRLLAACVSRSARAAARLDESGRTPSPEDLGPGDSWLDRSPDAWFATERPGLVAAVGQAARAARWPAVWQLALALSDFFERHSLWDDWRATHELALLATRRVRDRRAEAQVLRRLGDLRLDEGDWPAAQDRLAASVATAREVGDRQTEALALRALGDLHREQTRWEQALAYYDECLPLFRGLGDRHGEAEILRELGIIHREQGAAGAAVDCLERCLALPAARTDRRWEAIARRSLGMAYRSQRRLTEARDCFDASLAAFTELEDRRWAAYTCTGHGLLSWDQGQLAEAADWLDRALATFRDYDDQSGEAYALQVLGDVRREQGRQDEAATDLRCCLDLFGRLGDRRGEAYGRHSLGLLHHHAGRFEAAVDCFGDAVATFRGHHLRPWEARALANLGRSRLSLGDRAAAAADLEAALAVSVTLDLPEPAEVAALRDALAGDPGLAPPTAPSVKPAITQRR